MFKRYFLTKERDLFLLIVFILLFNEKKRDLFIVVLLKLSVWKATSHDSFILHINRTQ